MLRGKKRLPMAVASVGLLLTGCGTTGDEAAGEPPDETGTAVAGLGVGGSYTVLGALAELPPAPDESFLVRTADLTGASEAAGIERPTTEDAVGAWFNPLTGLGDGTGQDSTVYVPAPAFLRYVPDMQQFRDVAGWSLLDVDAYVELATEPDGFTVVSGEFADDTLHHLPEVAEGVRTVGEGEDLQVDLTQRSAVSGTGQPVRMGQADDKLAMGARTPAVEGWLTGAGPSLADDAQLSALAQALDAHDVVSALLYVSPAGAFTHLALPSGAEPAELDFLPEVAFTATAVGWTVEDERPRMIIAYHYPSADVAGEAVEDLRTMFTEGRTLGQDRPVSTLVELMELSAEGSVVVATLDAVDDRAQHLLAHLLTSRDVPFAHQ